MNKYWEILISGYINYGNFLVHEILNPTWNNYFYWVLGSTVVIWALELLFPWRKEQPALRLGFWIDIF